MIVGTPRCEEAAPKRRCFMPSAEPLRFEIEISAIGLPVSAGDDRWERGHTISPVGRANCSRVSIPALSDTPVRDEREDAPP